MIESAAIRDKFLKFFESKGHAHVDSSPLVPANDPTLLFTNSGMVQFKDVFLGFDKRPYKTAVTAQRCLRAGGKHNDLQNVGYTGRHHTFFEMLGNFSFGDYFKEKAIPFAWEFLTSPQWLGLDKQCLWVTVFGGGDLFGDGRPVPADDDAFALWKKTLCDAGFSDAEAERRITRIGTSDNFWMMGDTGPCGPCSEIFYDRDADAQSFRGEDEAFADDCVEVWNLVFMQFNRSEAGELSPLPAPCVDTGMGLERICAVMQGVSDNYQTDLFQKILAAADEEISRAGGETVAGRYVPSHRVAADHIRAAAYLVADGVLPSNEGRGYVLRKIIRRGLIHGGKASGRRDFGGTPWFCKLAAHLPDIMGGAGGIVADKMEEIQSVLEAEERGFFRNFMDGRARLETKMEALKGSSGNGKGIVFPGADAFELYDTFGFPFEATMDAVSDDPRFTGIDQEEFDKCMDEQRARSRAAAKFEGGSLAANYDGEATAYVGDEDLQAEAKVLAVFADGKEIGEARPGDDVLLILDRTPFYAESGGQVGDEGIIAKDGARARVLDVQKIRADVRAHVARVEEGAFAAGDQVRCEVDAGRRVSIAANHSATHLLHAALRRVLGGHVRQRGSLVAPGHLRFDFSHGAAVDEEQLREAERIVNAQIRANDEVRIERLPYDEAVGRGAMALFGEKYGDIVRMVSIDDKFSMELCGGSHVRRAGDIGYFCVSGEGAIAAGVRRIEAKTADAALAQAQDAGAQLRRAAAALKSAPENTAEKIERLQDMLKDAQKQIASLAAAGAVARAGELAESAREINGAQVLAEHIPGADMKSLREALAQLRGKLPQAAVMLAGDGGGAASFVAASGGDADARKWLEHAAAAAGAKGGGKKEYAQAGGGDPGKIPSAIQAAREFFG